MNPFVVLNLPRDCSDADVRSRYHELIRKYPPEHFPHEFQCIQEAASALKDARSRRRVHLFHLANHYQLPMATLEEFARLPDRRTPPGFPAFKAFIRACASAARDKKPSAKNP
jgi:DnaJ-class molecular chaperone